MQMENLGSTLCPSSHFINHKIKFLHLKKWLKRTISWNKCRSEIKTPLRNNLDYMIDPTFRNINRLVLSFKNGNNDPMRDSFHQYYMSLAEIKDLDTLIDNKPIFDQPIKNKQKACEELFEMLRNNDYGKENLLDHSLHQNY